MGCKPAWKWAQLAQQNHRPLCRKAAPAAGLSPAPLYRSNAIDRLCRKADPPPPPASITAT